MMMIVMEKLIKMDLQLKRRTKVKRERKGVRRRKKQLMPVLNPKKRRYRRMM